MSLIDGELLVRLAFCALAVSAFGTCLAVRWDDSSARAESQAARGGITTVVHLEPVELPTIDPLPFDKMLRDLFSAIKSDARARCKADGGEWFLWNCSECPMRCFGKPSCDKSGCMEGPELWAVDP